MSRPQMIPYKVPLTGLSVKFKDFLTTKDYSTTFNKNIIFFIKSDY